jgi:hypothetical protein
VDVLHGHLEPVEAPGLWDLDLGHESLSEVLEHNTVRSGKKGEDVLDEVLLTFIELLPIFQVLAQVDLFSCPEASHLILVHFPNVVVVNWKDHEPVGVLIEDGLWQLALSLILRVGLLGSSGHLLLDSSVLAVVVVHEL